MSSPFRLVKCLSHCLRVLRNRTICNQLVHQRCMSRQSATDIWSGNINNRVNTERSASQTFGLTTQQRNYDDRYDWRNPSITNTQVGMDASYKLPDNSEMTPRYDDEYWTSGRQVNMEMDTDGFDPRFDQRHYVTHRRNEERQLGEARRRYEKEDEANRSREAQINYMSKNINEFTPRRVREIENRRTLQMGTQDNQKQQERIIKENKRKWMRRSEPNREIRLPSATYKFDNPVYGAEHNSGQRRNKRDPAKDYSRRRRASRQKELKRQERELRKSRKGYNLPKAEDENSETMAESADWSETQGKKEDSQYWHSWHTCPDERRVFSEDEDVSKFEYLANKRKGLVEPPQNYDGSRRRYQTSTQRLNKLMYDSMLEGSDAPTSTSTNASSQDEPPSYGMRVKAQIYRKPSGMQKQIQEVWDFARNKRSVSKRNQMRQSSLMKAHLAQNLLVTDNLESHVQNSNIKDLDVQGHTSHYETQWDNQSSNSKRRSKAIQSMNFDEDDDEPKELAAPRVEPPRFRMSIKSKPFKRMRVPIRSFSESLRIKPRHTPHSEYTGYFAPTVCDTWKRFTSGMTSKPIY